ncbi:hypothetical protein OG339_48475 (plasmid) [Streptosporangium sp. NBC_01495]|nr:hypothetical protein [Streptosporangium sp. NBC_01495]
MSKQPDPTDPSDATAFLAALEEEYAVILDNALTRNPTEKPDPDNS